MCRVSHVLLFVGGIRALEHADKSVVGSAKIVTTTWCGFSFEIS